jgi:hypothetical protein
MQWCDEGFAAQGKTSEPVRQTAIPMGVRQVIACAAVALANRISRILLAVFLQGKAYDTRHVSVKPGIPTLTPAAPSGKLDQSCVTPRVR